MPASVRLERPSPIAFELADGRLVIVQPPTRAQVRAAIAYDPKEGEIRTHAQMNDQRARQLAALVGAKVTVREMRDGTEHDHEEDAGPILAGLTFEEESDMLVALTSYGFGQDPAAAVAIHAVLKKKSVPRVASRLADFDRDTCRLAVSLHRTMSEAENIGFVDSILLIDALCERQQEQARFEAGLHGLKLQ